MTLKTYIVFAVMFFVPMFLLALADMFDVPHLVSTFIILTPLFVVGRVLWHLGSRLKQ